MSSTAVEEMIGKIASYQAETKGLIHKLEQNVAYMEDVKVFLVQTNVVRTEKQNEAFANTPKGKAIQEEERPRTESPPVANSGLPQVAQPIALTNKIKNLNVGDKAGIIIARVSNVGKPYTAKTKWGEKQVQPIRVKDDSNWEVAVSLWEKDVDKFPEGSVVVITGAQLGEYKNEKQLQIEKGGGITLA